MCIAIVKPKGIPISDEYLENCFENNGDGAGIAYAKDGNIHIVKGIFDINEFKKEVREAEDISEGDMLIHCRISTSGKKDMRNCHPHRVNSSVVMIHNGILNINVPKKSKVSDTIIFIDQYLKNLPEDFIFNPAILKLIEKVIGSNNKFAFLNNEGKSAVCNPQAGVIENGIWFSNETYSYKKWQLGVNSCYVDDEYLYEFLREYIDVISKEELEELGNYPLIDKENYELTPFDNAKSRNMSRYMTLQLYSYALYAIYLNKYHTLVSPKKYQIASRKNNIVDFGTFKRPYSTSF